MISCFSSDNKVLTMDIFTYETEKLKSVYFLWHMVKYTHENNCCV